VTVALLALAAYACALWLLARDRRRRDEFHRQQLDACRVEILRLTVEAAKWREVARATECVLWEDEDTPCEEVIH
jgi:hypothetical protein